MASYLPHHRKKKIRLARLEDDLRRLIARGSGLDKLHEAALKIRDQRIRVRRAIHNEHADLRVVNRGALVKDEQEINSLRALTAEEVLAEFVKKHGKTE